MWEVRTQDRSGVQPAPTLTTQLASSFHRPEYTNQWRFFFWSLVSMGMRLILNVDDGGGVGV